MFSVGEPSTSTSVTAGRARWSDEATEDLVDVVQGLLIDPGDRANESLYQSIIRTMSERGVVA